jgi:hypothetical protein
MAGSAGTSGSGGAIGGAGSGGGGSAGTVSPPCGNSVGIAAGVCVGGGWCSMEPPGAGRQAVWGTSPSDVWTGGEGSLLRWDGRAWSAVASDSGTMGIQGPFGIWAISGSSTTDVWAVGGDGFNGIILHWNGAAWTTLAKGPGWPPFDGVWSSGPDDVWVLGSGIRHWDGAAWSTDDSGAVNDDAWGSSADDVWAVGSRGVLPHWD